MRDLIVLQGVRAFGYHGVLPEERREGQEFVVDAEIRTDVAAAAAHDDLSQTVDYSQVGATIVSHITGEPHDLIETLAERIASSCLAFPGVAGVTVTVHKPHAPVGVPFTDVRVVVSRGEP